MEMMTVKTYSNSIILISLICILLTGCNDNISISPSISANGEDIAYIGYVGSPSETNGLPDFYTDIEPIVVRPKTKVQVYYEDKPKKVLLKQWNEGKLTREEIVKEYSFITPNEEGVYVYNIGARWNFSTASSVVFVLEVQK
jgi:hypothetical protein